MIIEIKLDSGDFFVFDKRVNMSFFAKTKEEVEKELKRQGYTKGYGIWIMPEDIVAELDISY